MCKLVSMRISKIIKDLNELKKISNQVNDDLKQLRVTIEEIDNNDKITDFLIRNKRLDIELKKVKCKYIFIGSIALFITVIVLFFLYKVEILTNLTDIKISLTNR